MYRVRFILQRAGYRTRHLEGIFIAPDPPPSVAEMKRRCTEYLRRQLEARDPVFREFSIEPVLFKRLRTDFLYDGSQGDR